MSLLALSKIISLLLAITRVIAQSTFPATPLASKRFAYPTGIPAKVDTDVGLIRGTQLGYNICNSTTENQKSLCQTSIFNGLDDFCLWAPSVANKTVGEAEGEMVAWCSKPGHGTRLIPAGALTGIQFLKTPDYIQIVGFLDQTLVNIAAGDFGGEMDPHGADLRGNPMGGLLYSTNFTGSYVQVIEWTNFIGGNAFCLKACNPSGNNAAQFCQHIYDRIGCAYNAPNAAQNKVFESCDAENGDFPGVYTSNGVVQTYTQPAESLGPITTQPYSVRIPSSSKCQTFSSAALFTGLPPVSATSSSSSGASGSRPTGQAGTTTGSARPARTSTADATALSSSGFSAVIGVILAALFLSS
ncbi:manno protein [Phlegmacium glaucopus]|nr:manno protein [Phlegmacium glaucopus]